MHRLVAGRRLILGGVSIPCERGLLGHSDADVLTHATIDALLGAAGLGDIGTHFPDTDPAFAGADSIDLLRRTMALVAGAGWQPINLDATVIAERPRIAPHTPAIRAKLGEVLGLPAEAISVKGKTNEGLGPLGQGKGIAAMAAVIMERTEVDKKKP